ncbi:MAG TPA: ribonuclease J, partial [Polyangiaceae bacterium]|nr:ribonuclease J [Polyangiaceae bacterium]
PLGGLGRIGMNCLAVEQADGIVVIDCGIAFPDPGLGVDVVHPDFTWLLERADRVRGVFLTHGHEDHIGGLPYLLNELDVPVWGPAHALAMARRRLTEHEFSARELDLRPVRAGETVNVGSFEIEPVRVTHSIVEASALRIATAGGTLLHTGDFNLDADPPDGEPTDEARLARIGDDGVALLLSDSTNSEVPERFGSERSVAGAVEALVAGAPGLVLVGLFASNVQRLIMLGDMARRLGRKVLVLGRSLDSQVQIATELKRLAWPSNLMVGPDEAKGVLRDRLLVLAGGTQAEPGSALKRLSLGQHPALRLEAGDTVILSSRVIPGNERLVFEMQNDLLRHGVTLHHRVSDPNIHTSGHAAQKEQRRMLELVRPRCFLPIHGTLSHLRHHADLARDFGVREVTVVEDGVPVLCDGASLVAEARVPQGRVAIALGGEPLSDDTLKERADLARNGVAVVAITVGRRELAPAPPRVVVRGVPGVTAAVVRGLEREVARSLDVYRAGQGLSLEDFVRRNVRRKLEEASGTRPMIEVLTSELG